MSLGCFVCWQFVRFLAVVLFLLVEVEVRVLRSVDRNAFCENEGKKTSIPIMTSMSQTTRISL